MGKKGGSGHPARIGAYVMPPINPRMNDRQSLIWPPLLLLCHALGNMTSLGMLSWCQYWQRHRVGALGNGGLPPVLQGLVSVPFDRFLLGTQAFQ